MNPVHIWSMCMFHLSGLKWAWETWNFTSIILGGGSGKGVNKRFLRIDWISLLQLHLPWYDVSPNLDVQIPIRDLWYYDYNQTFSARILDAAGETFNFDFSHYPGAGETEFDKTRRRPRCFFINGIPMEDTFDHDSIGGVLINELRWIHTPTVLLFGSSFGYSLI